MNNNLISQVRLQKELQTILIDPIPLIYIAPKNDNLLEWDGYIIGPENTPFENGKFRLNIMIPTEYPFVAPTVVFITKIFHPNISVDGKICVDILKNKWLPSITLQKLLISILSLFSSPNPQDPLNEVAGKLYIMDKKKYDEVANKYTTDYAI